MPTARYRSVDATTQLVVRILRNDARLAIPCEPGGCAISVGARREHPEFEEFVVYRTVTYGRLKGKTTWLRWRTSKTAWEIICSYDINNKNKKITVNRIPPEGVEIIFKPMKPSKQLDYLRSPVFKKIREVSKEKNANKTKRRQYRVPDPLSLAGVRWGNHKHA